MLFLCRCIFFTSISQEAGEWMRDSSKGHAGGSETLCFTVLMQLGHFWRGITVCYRDPFFGSTAGFTFHCETRKQAASLSPTLSFSGWWSAWKRKKILSVSVYLWNRAKALDQWLVCTQTERSIVKSQPAFPFFPLPKSIFSTQNSVIVSSRFWF